jgi:DNA polymerase (family 10)
MVADIFSGMADILELLGENPFRVRAYRRAARTIEGQPKDVEHMSDDDVRKLPGIGTDLAAKIDEIRRTGHLAAYEELKRRVPEGLTVLLSIPGLGPKTAKLLHDNLHVADIDELERLAHSHRLAGLPGIKEKTEQNILKGIQSLRRHSERTPLGVALPLAEELLLSLKGKAPVRDLEVAGSIRRRRETVRDIDILCTSKNPKAVMDVFLSLPQVSDVMAQGPTKSSVRLTGGIQVDLRVVEEAAFGSALAYFTGSKAHNVRLREMAVKAGLKISEYGVYRGKKRLGGRRERDIYDALGLPLVPPELREDRGEIEAARDGRLPRLLELGDMRGDLHVHTSRSDGRHTPGELAAAARERGYSYLAITDHSKGLGIAGGLSEGEIMEEMREIDALNKKLRGFRLLKGVEVDIRSDLSLDLPDELLERLDIVVASIHSGFRQSGDKLTSRLTAAMSHPSVHVIAHPTGRILGERDAYDLNMQRVLETARDTGTALEINAYPMRLDLSDIHARAAADMGVAMVISTDTHLLDQLDYMSYGVATARRGWLEKADVLNTLDIRSLMKRLKKPPS